MTLTAIPGGVRLELHVQPGASTTEVAGLHGDRLKVRVQAPPVDGRANEAVLAWLARRCGVAQHRVRLVRGEHARAKTVEIDGVSEAVVRQALLGD